MNNTYIVWIEQYKVRIEYSTMIDTPVVDAAVHPVAVSLSGGDAKAHHQIWWYHHRFLVHQRKCLHSIGPETRIQCQMPRSRVQSCAHFLGLAMPRKVDSCGALIE